MATGQHQNASSSPQNDESIKLAVAISLLRSKLLHCRNQNADDPSSESDALRWKRKAKDRKQELLRLREDLREAEDALHYDLLPQSASCKCYFFDNLGKLSPSGAGDGSDYRFNDVLRRRFLRQVRLQERRRKRTSDSTQRRRFTDLNSEDEVEQLRASVDFLVDLCDTVSPAEEANFANWSHQAVDFILASLRNLLSAGKNMESIEGTIRSLIMRLVRRMCSSLKDDDASESDNIDNDSQFCIQHMIRKLAFDPYIGHRVMLLVSQRISVLAEKLLFSDPFDDAFPNMHSCMFLLMQLMEFVISEYLVTWSRAEAFDSLLFEEWVKSVLQARKAAELLENRNGLYVLYMDRVTGLLTKQVGQISSLPKFNRDILDKLFL
ncbi:protein MULTIPOLAR SPINDLE 1 [Citrus sinensis]|uniref:protein MULTIPOLAR SPINDLE 1 isoform X3 n=1 Tax=Citrus clementina TaxID=85681 RepID=UPI000CED4232|nr:protein MULTIPOLAR SPINDLE 1 isoform X3 [Citrus x clementina]XP_024952992.2 protein MULTIPOLAR SPINDLE 1 isoform X3 [Citrus sinensis]KAH9654332.1 protein MULTIPOLAR SPINDLE 1 [Citrus sinensis]